MLIFRVWATCVTTCIGGLGFGHLERFTLFCPLLLIMLASQTLLQRSTMLKIELESLFNEHFVLSSIISRKEFCSPYLFLKVKRFLAGGSYQLE